MIPKRRRPGSAQVTYHPMPGIGIEGLLKEIGPALPRRTQQRRLASLVAQRRVQTTGEGRALKYPLAEIVGTLAAQEAGDDEPSAAGETYIPLSAEGAAGEIADANVAAATKAPIHPEGAVEFPILKA